MSLGDAFFEQAVRDTTNMMPFSYIFRNFVPPHRTRQALSVV